MLRRPLRRFGADHAVALAAATLALTLTPASHGFAATAAVPLGTADAFAVLAGSGVTNTGVTTITGDTGSSPTPSQTGFAPCPAVNCVNQTGTNHNAAAPNDVVTQQAKADLTIAYDDAFGRTGGTAVTAPLGGGTTLVSGVYTSAADIFVGGDLTLDAGGDPNAVFIFQAKTGTLITAAGITAGVPNTRVLLRNGAQACNVFWQVGSSATISTFTQFVGTILANQSITMNTRATLEAGRVLARNAAVTLDTNTITKATCATPAGGGDPPPGGGGGGGTTPPTGGGGTTPPASGDGTNLAAGGGGSPTPTPTPGTISPPAAPASSSPGSAGAAAAGASPTSRPLPGTAVLTGPRDTVDGPFTVSVTGRAIESVTFYVDGRRVKTVRAKSGRKRFKLKIDPRGQSRRVHRVTARVRFTPKSRTSTTTRRVTYRRPSLAPRSPRFTG